MNLTSDKEVTSPTHVLPVVKNEVNNLQIAITTFTTIRPLFYLLDYVALDGTLESGDREKKNKTNKHKYCRNFTGMVC